MYKNFGVQSTGFKKTGELILNVKEVKRIRRLLHYLSFTGQLSLTDSMFYECINDHYKALTEEGDKN